MAQRRGGSKRGGPGSNYLRSSDRAYNHPGTAEYTHHRDLRDRHSIRCGCVHCVCLHTRSSPFIVLGLSHEEQTGIRRHKVFNVPVLAVEEGKVEVSGNSSNNASEPISCCTAMFIDWAHRTQLSKLTSSSSDVTEANLRGRRINFRHEYLPFVGKVVTDLVRQQTRKLERWWSPRPSNRIE